MYTFNKLSVHIEMWRLVITLVIPVSTGALSSQIIRDLLS